MFLDLFWRGITFLGLRTNFAWAPTDLKMTSFLGAIISPQKYYVHTFV